MLVQGDIYDTLGAWFGNDSAFVFRKPKVGMCHESTSLIMSTKMAARVWQSECTKNALIDGQSSKSRNDEQELYACKDCATLAQIIQHD